VFRREQPSGMRLFGNAAFERDRVDRSKRRFRCVLEGGTQCRDHRWRR